MATVEQKVTNVTETGKTQIKRYIYDLVAGGIILAIIAASLNVFGFYDFSGENAIKEFSNFFVDWVPYFIASVLLHSTIYEKGTFTGKQTKSYLDMASSYSKLVNSLTGEQLDKLDDFCIKYNEKALKDLQTKILKRNGISYEIFEQKYLNMSKNEIKKTCIKEHYKTIIKAKNAHIKGINANKLLSQSEADDITDTGHTEHELAKRYKITSTIKVLISTLCTALIVAKDIAEWGWSGLIIVIFKVLFVFGRSYMGYFTGYKDITIDVISSLGRKCDILKMFINDFDKENVKISENEVINTDIKS